MAPINYTIVEMSETEIADERHRYGALADAVRALADASLRTTVPADVVAEVTQQVQLLADRLAAEQIDGSFGVSLTASGTVRGHGNAVVGLRNPAAVPLRVEKSAEGRAWAGFTLGALHEGPPGMCHGGVAALLLDQLLGEAAAAGGSPGMTGTLTLRYVQNTPLGECSAEAWIERTEGIKTIVRGVLRRADGETTVEAEGIFILPRWARAALAESDRKPPRFE